MTDIRFITPEDLPAIHQMICALSRFHGDTATVTPEKLDEIFFGTCPTGVGLVAKQGAATVGYAGLTTTVVLHRGRPRIDIHHLFVKDGYRAQGIGTALIAKAKTYAMSVNAEKLTIGTDPDNAVSIAAYRAMPALAEIADIGPRFSVDLTP